MRSVTTWTNGYNEDQKRDESKQRRIRWMLSKYVSEILQFLYLYVIATILVNQFGPLKSQIQSDI